MKRIKYKENAECNCMVLDEVKRLWNGNEEPDFLMETCEDDGISIIHLPNHELKFSEGDVLVFTGEDIYVE